MTLSRRSFLKVAGLSAVAVAGASMFTGCATNVVTPIQYESADDTLKDVVAALNKNAAATSVLGSSDLHKDPDKNKEYVTNLIGGLSVTIKALKDVEVESAVLTKAEKDSILTGGYYIKVVLKKKATE